MAEYNKPAEISEPEKGGFRKFLWNGEKGEFLGRTGLSWAKIGVFYLIFYACLAGWWAGLLNVFFLTLDADKPTHYGVDSLLQGNPGIALRPAPVFDTALIRFTANKPSSFKPYTDHLEAFLKSYEEANVQGTDIGACDLTGNVARDVDKACEFKLDVQQPSWCEKETSYGYADGLPCVVIKMNKLYDFVPDVYENVNDMMDKQGLKTRPRFLAMGDDGMNVGVSCEGQTAADRENINGITFKPANGINKVYYPYRNQEGYRSPLLFARLNVTNRVVVQITCKLYAKNIDNSDGQRKHGSLHFELLRD